MGVKVLVATLVVTLASAGVASAAKGPPSAAVLAADGARTYNKRLAFMGEAYRVSGMRCLKKSSVSYFCKAQKKDMRGRTVDPPSLTVTISADGQATWALNS